MPRPASSVWSHFRRDGPTKRAVCKYCQHNMVGLVTRMRVHLARKCPECPINVKSEMFEADMNRKMDLTAMVPAGAGAAASVASVAVGASSPHHHHHLLHAGHLLKKPRRGRNSLAGGPTGAAGAGAGASLDDKADLDSYVAKAILGAALPVGAVENASFVKLIKRLSPAYELPSAFTLATSALDLEYTEVQLRLRAEVLDAASVCLGVESWSAPSTTSTGPKRAILSFVINTPNPGVFAFENTGEAPHTPEVLIEKIEHVMTQIGTGKVSVIVMDLRNAHMKQAALALEAKYPNITFLPSCAHAMAAMMQDILSIPSLANTLAVCRLIAQYFSQNHLAKAAFARVSEPLQALEASYPLHEPADDSAVAQLECLFGVERNHHSFEVLLAENGPLAGLDAHAKEQMINLTFWEELATYTGLLEPFLDLMKTFDSDYPLLSTFYHRFTQLWGHLQKYGDLATKVQQIMSDHWQAIRHPAMYTAYILDPRFPDAGLVTDVSNEVLTYLKRSADPPTEAHIVAELTRYTGRVGMFADDAVWESAQKCSPIHWWKGFIGGSVPHLQSVALRNLCFPASSGLAKHRREMFDKIYQMNSKYMSEEQASKAALVYLNTNLSSAGGDVGLSNETLV